MPVDFLARRDVQQRKERPVLEAFFISLMILVCVGTAAFAGLTIKKLYQGQR